IHFPPGVRNTPTAALYGVENINRGCRVDIAGDAIFAKPVPRPTSIAGTFGAGAGVAALPCEPSDTRGCARGGPILDLDGHDLSEPLGSPAAVFIDGVRLPFFGTCTNIPCIRASLKTQPRGSSSGQFTAGRLAVLPRAGQQAPEQYLIAPRAAQSPDGLSSSD